MLSPPHSSSHAQSPPKHSHADPTVHHRRELRCTQPDPTAMDSYQRDIVAHFARMFLPDLDIASPEAVCRCLYTSTVDGDFVLGQHPGDSRVVVATGFHGEGFKFSPVIG